MEIKNLIKNYLKQNNLSKIKLCKLIGINVNILNKLLNGQLNFRARNLIKIARFFKISVDKIVGR